VYVVLIAVCGSGFRLWNGFLKNQEKERE